MQLSRTSLNQVAVPFLRHSMVFKQSSGEWGQFNPLIRSGFGVLRYNSEFHSSSRLSSAYNPLPMKYNSFVSRSFTTHSSDSNDEQDSHDSTKDTDPEVTKDTNSEVTKVTENKYFIRNNETSLKEFATTPTNEEGETTLSEEDDSSGDALGVGVSSPEDPTLDPDYDEFLAKPLLPKEIVTELDKHIIGQREAKKAVAVALRNRWRRQQLDAELATEIIPKNLLMIGPTGVGKTEVARRLAKLAQAPFIKVEATKFTEVGFHGRDVDSIIRDLVEIAFQDVSKRSREREKLRLKEEIEERLLDILTGCETRGATRESFRKMLRSGALEQREVEFEITEARKNPMDSPQFENVVIQLGNLLPARKVKKKMTLSECRPYIEEQETEKVVNKDTMIKKAMEMVQSRGIVFIDEIDKICEKSGGHHGVDASSEGVQRDLLPLIEGTTITTKHGNVDTSKILFIASGAFHSCKPSDLLAELQGRLPIRVQLKPLLREDLYNILTQTQFNQIEQIQKLMETEEVKMEFTEEALQEIAKITSEVNETVENIGARRLHTVLERIIEDISYECPRGEHVIITKKHVTSRLSDMLIKTDLSKYIL